MPGRGAAAQQKSHFYPDKLSRAPLSTMTAHTHKMLWIFRFLFCCPRRKECSRATNTLCCRKFRMTTTSSRSNPTNCWKWNYSASSPPSQRTHSVTGWRNQQNFSLCFLHGCRHTKGNYNLHSLRDMPEWSDEWNEFDDERWARECYAKSLCGSDLTVSLFHVVVVVGGWLSLFSLCCKSVSGARMNSSSGFDRNEMEMRKSFLHFLFFSSTELNDDEESTRHHFSP